MNNNDLPTQTIRETIDKFIKSIVPGSPADKVLGMIYGHAIGDAVGLRAEFKFKSDKPDISFPYDKSVRNFPICDWTDDTDHLLIVAQSMIENKFKFVPGDIAARLKSWVKTGFKELGDTTGAGVDGALKTIITHSDFLTNPTAAATEIWHTSGKKLANNGSLTRNCITGIFTRADECESWARDLSALTHVDPRCITSCVIHSLLTNAFIYNQIKQPEHVNQLLKFAVDRSLKYINASAGVAPTHTPTNTPTYEDELSHWINLGYTNRIEELKLDEMANSHVFKCLACAIYALQVIKVSLKNNTLISFKKVIYKIAAECGDADANCAVAGSLLGAHMGFSNLPREWVEALPYRLWLDSIIMNLLYTFTNMLNDREGESDPPLEKDTTDTRAGVADIDNIADTIDNADTSADVADVDNIDTADSADNTDATDNADSSNVDSNANMNADNADTSAGVADTDNTDIAETTDTVDNADSSDIDTNANIPGVTNTNNVDDTADTSDADNADSSDVDSNMNIVNDTNIVDNTNTPDNTTNNADSAMNTDNTDDIAYADSAYNADVDSSVDSDNTDTDTGAVNPPVLSSVELDSIVDSLL